MNVDAKYLVPIMQQRIADLEFELLMCKAMLAQRQGEEAIVEIPDDVEEVEPDAEV